MDTEIYSTDPNYIAGFVRGCIDWGLDEKHATELLRHAQRQESFEKSADFCRGFNSMIKCADPFAGGMARYLAEQAARAAKYVGTARSAIPAAAGAGTMARYLSEQAARAAKYVGAARTGAIPAAATSAAPGFLSQAWKPALGIGATGGGMFGLHKLLSSLYGGGQSSTQPYTPSWFGGVSQQPTAGAQPPVSPFDYMRSAEATYSPLSPATAPPALPTTGQTTNWWDVARSKYQGLAQQRDALHKMILAGQSATNPEAARQAAQAYQPLAAIENQMRGLQSDQVHMYDSAKGVLSNTASKIPEYTRNLQHQIEVMNGGGNLWDRITGGAGRAAGKADEYSRMLGELNSRAAQARAMSQAQITQ